MNETYNNILPEAKTFTPAPKASMFWNGLGFLPLMGVWLYLTTTLFISICIISGTALILFLIHSFHKSHLIIDGQGITSVTVFRYFLGMKQYTLKWEEIDEVTASGKWTIPVLTLKKKTPDGRGVKKKPAKGSLRFGIDYLRVPGLLEEILSHVPEETINQRKVQRAWDINAYFKSMQHFRSTLIALQLTSILSYLVMCLFVFQGEEYFGYFFLAPFLLSYMVSFSASFCRPLTSFWNYLAGFEFSYSFLIMLTIVLSLFGMWYTLIAIHSAVAGLLVFALGLSLFERRWKNARIPVVALALLMFLVPPAIELFRSKKGVEVARSKSFWVTKWTPDGKEFVLFHIGDKNKAEWYSADGKLLKCTILLETGSYMLYRLGQSGAIIRRNNKKNKDKRITELWYLPRKNGNPKKILTLDWLEYYIGVTLLSPDGEKYILGVLKEKSPTKYYMLDFRDGALRRVKLDESIQTAHTLRWRSTGELRWLVGAISQVHKHVLTGKYKLIHDRGETFTVRESAGPDGSPKKIYEAVKPWVDYLSSPELDYIIAKRIAALKPFRMDTVLIDLNKSPPTVKPFKRDLQNLKWLPNGPYVLMEGPDRKILKINVKTGETSLAIDNFIGDFERLDISPDGNYAAVRYRAHMFPQRLLIYSLKTGKRFWIRNEAASWGFCQWSPDSSRLLYETSNFSFLIKDFKKIDPQGTYYLLKLDW